MKVDGKDIKAINAVFVGIQNAEFYRLSGKDVIEFNGALAHLQGMIRRIQEDLKALSPKSGDEPIKLAKGKK